jgi:phage shock protein A
MTKPGLFGRLKNAISATLNSAVDSVSDPGQEIALMIDDLGAQIKKGEANLKQAVVDQKVLERKVEGLAKDEENWQQKAEAALRLDDEGLARAALERKTELGGQREAATMSLGDQKQVVVEMKLELEAAKSKYKNLNLKRGTLMAQARAAKESERGTVASAGTGTSAQIEAIEDKVAEIEAMNEVSRELSTDAKETAALEARFRALDAGSEVDDELEALKAKVGGSRALTSGDEGDA